jgi:hypothetical protein
MNKTIKFLLAMMITGMFFVVGCGDNKGSCEKLAKVKDRCTKSKKSKSIKQVQKKCELKLKMGDPLTKAAVYCSKDSTCKSYYLCMISEKLKLNKNVINEKKRNRKDFKEQELKKQVYNFIKKGIKDINKDLVGVDVVRKCKHLRKEVGGVRQRACKKLNTFIYDELVKVVEDQIKAGTYDVKKSWTIKSYGKMAGRDVETDLLMAYASINQSVTKYLKTKKGSLPHNCNANLIDQIVANSVESLKYKNLIIDTCFNKMGLPLLTEINSKKHLVCKSTTKELIANITRYKIKNAALTKIAAKVKAKCDKKKKK